MFSKKYNEKIFLCPRCGIEMKKIKKHDVIIDVCKKCKGMWLDDSEIDKLMMLAQQGGKHGKN